MQRRHWTHELRRLGLWLLLALLPGWLLGVPGWALALAALAYALRLLYDLWRLQQWLLLRAQEAPPEAPGLWGEVMDALYHRQRRERDERQRLEALIVYLRESLASLPYGAVMVDAAGDIEWCNPAATEMLGLRYPEDRGFPLVNLVRDPAFIHYFESEIYDGALDMPCPQDRRRFLQLHTSFFGQRSRLVFVRDVTRNKRLEQMRKDFVANVSHELRTPLTVISGYLDTFAGGLHGANPRWRRAVAQMLEQAQRMQSLIDDLMLLSRLESVPPDSDQERFDVRPMLDSIAEEARAAADGQRHIEIESDDSLSLVGHPQELRSAFANLIYNAAKYTEPGGHIRIRWYIEGDQARLSVEDDGIGVDEEHIPRLTERFYRVDKSRSTRTGGTGLGLAIVKHVLLRHQAELEIHSEFGKGSRFTCVFPLLRTVRQRLGQGAA